MKRKESRRKEGIDGEKRMGGEGGKEGSLKFTNNNGI